MGIYPNQELDLQHLKSKSNMTEFENNQLKPRELKNHLIHYKFRKVIAGQHNSALITESG
jgi:hypothetical protein